MQVEIPRLGRLVQTFTTVQKKEKRKAISGSPQSKRHNHGGFYGKLIVLLVTNQ